jgi:hypothetical protein
MGRYWAYRLFFPVDESLVPESIELAGPELRSYGMRIHDALTTHKE